MEELLEILKLCFSAFVAWGVIAYYFGKFDSWINKRREEKDEKNIILSRISKKIRLNKNGIWESVEEIEGGKTRVIGPAEKECPEIVRFFELQEGIEDAEAELLESMGFLVPDSFKGEASLIVDHGFDTETDEEIREIVLEKKIVLPKQRKKKRRLKFW